MAQHILIPVALDHESVVPRKIDVARKLLGEGGKITLLTVLEDVPGFVAEFVDLKPSNHLSVKVKERLDQVVTGKAGVKISEYAGANGVDLIIVGSHHPSAQDYFLGSTASRVARRAPCSVYILR